MCGITGFIDFKGKSNTDILDEMILKLKHRGPDSSGKRLFYHDKFVVGLGHTRLSILDLSDAGHQPMTFENWDIVLNGEIYNYTEVRKDLINLGHTFITNTDTEVILHAFKEWGESCIHKFIGMFAFTIYNSTSSELYIFRDRVGVKPLYYYWHDNLFLFSSELKSFHEHPDFCKVIDANSIQLYMDHGYIPAPYSIFNNCKKLTPGTYIFFDLSLKYFELRKYWDVVDYYLQPTLKINYDDAKSHLEDILLSAFKYRMVSDVPVGVFLSGGYDSTAVTALLQSNMTDRLKTFTIGFKNGNDEAPSARLISKHLDTDHTEYYCTEKEAQNIVTDLPYIYDEPFADSSAIPTILVSTLAKKEVTVALSADAGDEIFAGYNIYDTFTRNLTLLHKLPQVFSQPLSDILWFTKKYFNNKYTIERKLEVVSEYLKAKENYKRHSILYKGYTTLSKAQKDRILLKGSVSIPTVFDDDFSNFKNPILQAMAIDYKMYLPDDILTKVDRATMSVGLEGREPFLDHRIIEYVARLPIEFKYGSIKKKILKDIVHKYVPMNLMDRPKTGFSIPAVKWLRGDLQFLIQENLLNASSTPYFNKHEITNIASGFLRGTNNDFNIIWRLLQFQLWYKKWM